MHTKRLHPRLLVVCTGLLAADVNLAHAQQGGGDNHLARNVESQLLLLKTHAEPLGYWVGNSTPPQVVGGHNQGIARWGEPGEPQYIAVSHAQDGGEIVIVEMGSRERTGERFRSNRLMRGSSYRNTRPPATDIVRGVIEFSVPAYDYWHPGGIQVIDKVLAVATQSPNEPSLPPAVFLLFDVADPLQPTLLARHHLREFWYGGVLMDVKGTGAVAIAKRPDTGTYILAAIVKAKPRLGGDESENWVVVLESRSTDLRDTSQPLDERLRFFDAWWSEELRDEGQDPELWKGGDGDPAFQSLNFIKQTPSGNNPPDLYLACGWNTSGFPTSGTDWIFLFKTRIDSPNQFKLRYATQKHLWRDDRCFYGSPDVSDQWGDFGAAGGVYVSPSGQLMAYSAEYATEQRWLDEVVRFGEWRNVQMTHNESLPQTGPWADFYIRRDGWTGNGNNACISITLDAKDEHLDDYLDLSDYSPRLRNEPRSVACFVPIGWTLRLWEHPGQGRHYTIQGRNLVQWINLDQVRWDNDPNNSPDLEVDAVQFLHGCATEVWNVPENRTLDLTLPAVVGGPCSVISLRAGRYPLISPDPYVIDKRVRLEARGRGLVQIDRFWP